MSAEGQRAVRGVSIEALELFVEVLSQSERAASGDDFYDRLCEAVCRLARMRRAVIFRYDAARRRVRAAGAHGLDLEQFADAHVTVESAPFAAEALREDAVVEVSGDLAGQIPNEYMALFPEPVRLVCAPMAASHRAIGVILADRLMSAPPVEEPERHLLWTLGKAAALASVARFVATSAEKANPARAADRPRTGDPRGGDPAAVRRIDGARRRWGSARARRAGRCASETQSGARRSSQRAATPARPRPAQHRDYVPQRGRAALLTCIRIWG